MAYIHCNDKCGYSSDDFWDLRFKPQWKFWRWRSVFGYNPITCFLESINEHIKPRWIGMDKYFIDEMISFGNRPIMRTFENPLRMYDPTTRRYSNYTLKNPHKSYEVFSWYFIWYDFKRNCRKFKNMKWWTYNDYKKDPLKLCPKCNCRIPSSNID